MTNMLKFIDSVTRIVDSSAAVDVVYLDIYSQSFSYYSEL